MKFEWTITLGTVLTILSVLGGGGWALFKFVFNHMEHLEGRMMEQINLLRQDVRDIREHLLSK